MNGPLGLPGFGPVQRYEAREALGFLSRGQIDGLTLSNDGTDATNDLGVAAGSARSQCRIVDGTASTLARDQIDLELPVAIIKQLDVLFAPENYDAEGYSGGDRSGGRSTSALADASWQALLIGGGGLATDVLLHDSATQANILAEMQKVGGYTAYRHLGGIKRATSLQPFHQFNDEFWLDTPVRDFNATPASSSAVTRALASIPTGTKVQAILQAMLTTPSTAAGGYLYFSSLDNADVSASTSVFTVSITSSVAATVTTQCRVWTDTSSQIRTRMSSTGASDACSATTLGWVHPRGRNS